VHPVVVSLAAAALGFAPANYVSHEHTAAAPAKRTAARSHVQLSTLESTLLGQINAARANHGLRPFRLAYGLTLAATQHSHSMAQKGYFSHDSANGGVFWRRIASYYGYRGYRDWSVGENILWSSPDVTPASAFRMWMESPEHRKNLLDREWREIGLGAVHVASAPGVYGGDQVTIVTADFGIRR
jgi:uncharacterized protein YkwD